MKDIPPLDPTASMSEVTKRAIEAVGKDDPRSDWILRPEEHAKNLPPQAGALKRILLFAEHKKTQESFRAHDALANVAQARYKAAGRRALRATLVGSLLGAVFLLPALQSIPPNLRASGTVVEYLLLAAAFLAARYLAVARPFPKWMEQRARAELARIRLFDEVIDAHEEPRDGELPLLPLQLEYFLRYQLEVQRRYYEGRGNQHQRAAGHTDMWEQASLVLSIAAGAIAFWASLPLIASLLAYLGVSLPPLVQRLFQFADGFQLDGRWLLALGVSGTALYGYAVSHSLMNLDERNASRYLTTYDNLNYLKECGLRQARDDAAAGEKEKVRKFVDGVQGLISSEHKEWISLRHVVAEVAPGL